MKAPESASHLVSRLFGRDLGEPQIDADAESVTEILTNATLVFEALSRIGIRHRFEICEDKLAAYLDWDWPSNEPNAGSR